MNILRTIIIIVFMILSGCAGILIEGVEKIELPASHIFNERGKISQSNLTSYSPEQLLQSWGEPDEIEKESDVEIWRYNTGIKWQGIYLAIIIPIPLLLPTGSDNISFYIKENKIIKAEVINNDLVYSATCGFVVGHFSFGCEARNYVPELNIDYYHPFNQNSL